MASFTNCSSERNELSHISSITKPGQSVDLPGSDSALSPSVDDPIRSHQGEKAR